MVPWSPTAAWAGPRGADLRHLRSPGNSRKPRGRTRGIAPAQERIPLSLCSLPRTAAILWSSYINNCADSCAQIQPLGMLPAARRTGHSSQKDQVDMPSIPPSYRPGLAASEVDLRLRSAVQAEDLAARDILLYFHEILVRDLYRDLQYPSMMSYACRSLELSKNRAWQFLRLARDLQRLPQLRRAVMDGEIGWTKAQLVARAATVETVGWWLEQAAILGRRKLAEKVRRSIQNARRQKRAQGPDDEGEQSVLDLPDNAHGAPGSEQDASPAGPAPSPPAGSRNPPRAQAGRSASVPSTTLNPGSAPGAGCRDDTASEDPCGGARLGCFEDGARMAGADDPGHLQDAAGRRSGCIAAEQDPPPGRVTVTITFDPVDYAHFESMLEAVRKARIVPAGTSREDILLAALATLSEPRLRASDGAAAGRQRDSGPAVAAGEGGNPSADDVSVPDATYRHARAPYTVIMARCPSCGGTEVLTGRGQLPVPAPAAEAALENARIHEDGRNRHAIPPSIRAAVLARDRYRCRTPGCGNRQFLELHHLVPREQGGANDPANLVTLCQRCHRFLHDRPDAADALALALSRALGKPTAARGEQHPGGSAAVDSGASDTGSGIGTATPES